LWPYTLPIDAQADVRRSPAVDHPITHVKALQAELTKVEASAMPNGRCRMHGGMSPGAPEGNKNAFKHGHYTAEAIATRREIAKLLRDARALVKQVN
jgi:hypothetical protein